MIRAALLLALLGAGRWTPAPSARCPFEYWHQPPRKPTAPRLVDVLLLAQATIERLQRHAPGSAIGTLDVLRAAIARVKGAAC